MPQHLTIAIVIPTLDEGAILSSAIASVRPQLAAGDLLLIADAGSSDGTKAVAERHGVRIVDSPRRGRGCQIAAAMAMLTHDIVLVMHADMKLPETALGRLRQWMLDHPNCPGGCFGHRFDNPHWSYRLIEWFDRRRARHGTSYGDQGQFFRWTLLQGVGGYPDVPIMEDIELSRRMNSIGRPAYLGEPVVVSARRFERVGLLRSVMSNAVFRLVHRWGPRGVEEKLHGYYYGVLGSGHQLAAPRHTGHGETHSA